MSDSPYIIGIDLGTTHCVVAYAAATVHEDVPPAIEIFSVTQLTAPNEVEAHPLLPSFIFLPGPHDVPQGSLGLPWGGSSNMAVGEFARKRGAEIPNRLIASAKSWLSHSGVDRTQAILPWDSPEDAARMSPVQASTSLLEHLRDAWNHKMAASSSEALFEKQEIYLTVPASFDAVARELTVKAANAAGLENITLLEEPQAAFYAWLEAMGDLWRKAVRVNDSILVCDVGGGTTDFSLIQVSEENGDLALKRAAVGDHILLGGDNMDLSLAYVVQAKLAQKGKKLDSRQFHGLRHSCRLAKERLLANPELESEPVIILGRGSSLIGSTIRTELTREEVGRTLVNGFFPMAEKSEYPQSKRRVGVREMGLPFEHDPAVTRHLAGFLGRQAGNADSDDTEKAAAYPTAVLFNGGVMKAPPLRDRILEVLSHWANGAPLRELSATDLDFAVARGAAYYGLARKGKGIRIRAGASRTYYIGIESSMPAVPGIPTPMKALCVVPFGMEEGTSAQISNRDFGLVVGEPAVFHLLASNVRKKDADGEVIEDWTGEIEEVTTMESELSGLENQGGQIIPIRLESRMTELGTLELWCVTRDQNHRWKLEFNLREREEG